MASDTDQVVQGIWYPAASNQGVAVAFRNVGEEAVVASTSDGKELARYAFSSTEASEWIGSIPRKVSFPDGSTFETTDNAQIDEILEQNGSKFWTAVHELEKFHPRLIGVVAVVFLFAFLVFKVAVWCLTLGMYPP